MEIFCQLKIYCLFQRFYSTTILNISQTTPSLGCCHQKCKSLWKIKMTLAWLRPSAWKNTITCLHFSCMYEIVLGGQVSFLFFSLLTKTKSISKSLAAFLLKEVLLIFPVSLFCPIVMQLVPFSKQATWHPSSFLPFHKTQTEEGKKNSKIASYICSFIWL